jgi:chromosome segregation ATPase
VSLAVEVQLQSKNKEIEELNDKQKKAAIELGKLKSSNKDITHQLETKTKQLKELTIDIESIYNITQNIELYMYLSNRFTKGCIIIT